MTQAHNGVMQPFSLSRPSITLSASEHATLAEGRMVGRLVQSAAGAAINSGRALAVQVNSARCNRSICVYLALSGCCHCLIALLPWLVGPRGCGLAVCVLCVCACVCVCRGGFCLCHLYLRTHVAADRPARLAFSWLVWLRPVLHVHECTCVGRSPFPGPEASRLLMATSACVIYA